MSSEGPGRLLLTLALVIGPLAAPALASVETSITGDARFFQFFWLQDISGTRRHAELGIARLKLVSQLHETLQIEVHGVLEITSPPRSQAISIASGTTRRLLDLEVDLTKAETLQARLELDRLNLRWEHPRFRLVLGRQTLTWGVNYFWPVLDLFAPFAPERIDREYKPGIDAVRMVIPVGDFSEIELVSAGQGKRFSQDFSWASLGRFHVEGADLGYMGGRFHGDNVIGAFLTTDVGGTGLRAEAAFTDSGDPEDDVLGRPRFVRVSAGLDRQVTAGITLTGEAHFNGFGTDSAAEYRRTAEADRVRRGEVTSFGRYYSGLSLLWRAHPLLGVSGVLLTNWGDRSSLLQTTGELSATENIVVQLGGIVGFGAGLDDQGNLQSEYGFVPLTIWGSFKVYF